jgi:hypothetical protein
MKNLFASIKIAPVLLLFITMTESSIAGDENIIVKYRGEVNLESYQCDWISRSSLIKRLCYDSSQLHVIVLLKQTYYQYCVVPKKVISEWAKSSSMGEYYNSNVKGNFHCN